MDKRAFALTQVAKQPPSTGGETAQQNFERVLSTEPFKGIKAILHSLSPDLQAVFEAVKATTSYEDLLSKLGYRMTLTKQIHVNDCYDRVGSAGGIKAVLPYHDVATQSSLPTLVNLDLTVTTTPKSAIFFNEMVAVLKARLNGQN